MLRSAPLMMMMMDAEEHLTQVSTKWKMRWREAITGDENMRIRDHMDNREVQKRVKLVDTASFTVSNIAVELEIDNFLICYVTAGNCDDHAIRIPSRWLPRRISLVLSHYKHPSHASQVNHPVMETRSEIQMSRRE